MTVVSGLWNGLMTIVGTAWGIIQGIIQVGVAIVQAIWEQHGAAITRVFQNAWNIIKTVVETVMGVIGALFDAFAAAFSGDWYTFGEKIREEWNLVWEGIKKILLLAWDNIKTIVSSLIANIIGFFRNTNWGAVGRNIVKGIANGLLSAIGWIRQAARDVANAAVQAMKGFLGIHSPSRLMERLIGKNMALGINVGFEKNFNPKLLNGVLSFAPAAGQIVSPYKVGEQKTDITVQVYANVADNIDLEAMAYRVAGVISRRVS